MQGFRFLLRFARDATVTESDADGRPTTYVPTNRSMWGSLEVLSAREAFRAQQYGENITAAAAVPVGSDVLASDRLYLDADTNPGVPAELVGEWAVAALQYSRVRLRVLLRRSDI